MEPVLVTERLVLRAFTPDDVDGLLVLDGDPEVMRFLGRLRTRAEIEAEGPSLIESWGNDIGVGRRDRGHSGAGARDLGRSAGRHGGGEVEYRLRRGDWTPPPGLARPA